MNTKINYAIEVQPIPYPGFDFPAGGRVAIVRDEPIDEVVALINQEGIEAVTLNCSKGWCSEDVSFLAELSNVRNLAIITSHTTGVQAIEKMVSLEELNITFSSKDTVDFTKLKLLKKAYIHWWSGAESVMDCDWITTAYLDEIRRKDFSHIANMTGLEKLTIANSNIKSLEWLSALKNLTELSLFNCRSLTDFSPIAQLKQLKRINIEGCNKLTDISFVADLPRLEILGLTGNSEIPSIAAVGGAKALKAIFFQASTNVLDGDLSALLTLPHLAILSFQPRKHYSHKLVKKWKWADFDQPDTLLQAKNQK